MIEHSYRLFIQVILITTASIHRYVYIYIDINIGFIIMFFHIDIHTYMLGIIALFYKHLLEYYRKYTYIHISHLE